MTNATLAPTERELTLRGLVLGALITIVFTAANVYLGLKIGLSFASSIPAAVISMAALRALGGGGILENNMVQTQASAAGTLSCVFASFPSLIMIGWWQDFPYLLTAGLSLAGGVTGVLFTIPLRRALVTNSMLPYPEGVAAAEILKVSSAEGNNRKLMALVTGGALSALVTLATGGLRLLADSIAGTFAIGPAIYRASTGFSLALLGAGYLVGIGGGLAMLLGVVIAWGVSVPWLSTITPNVGHLANADFAQDLWVHKVRFLGAGTIAVAAVWTLGVLIKPVFGGIRQMFTRTNADSADEADRDLSARTIVSLGAATLIAFAVFFVCFLWPVTGSTGIIAPVIAGVLFCAIFGFLVAAACGYMAGIVGSTSSPISGIGIIAIIAISSLMLGMQALGWLPASLSADGHRPAIAFALFVLSAIIASAAISNDNLQDLKTGQLLGASPRRQEIALLVGCISGAIIIPPVLNLLYHAYGFVGFMPRPDMDPTRVLAAPQSALMATIASGIFRHQLDWTMISIGAALGVVIIATDLLLKTRRLSLPPLAVGMGIYLPANVTVTLTIGAVIGWLVFRMARGGAQHTDSGIGTMLASGFIVGESLMGVGLAAIVGATGSDDTLSLVGPGFEPLSSGLGALAFIAVCVWFATRLRRDHE